ncbi:MAG: BioY family transporter [Candidatus Pelagibacter sp.]|nr:BioY family transporter [Candidatus Pelagibacter sp.]RPG11684.1 MAG: biotin transporter BioY [Pelagibacteraceae bacterium TMED170]|tara:strand:+ start:399 stop:950 length:552 start_codon:yes stop_codon:yes gene_type:complete
MELVKNIKQSQIIKKIFIALIGTIILAISSKIKIPFYPVPMTMQTFVVLFIGIAFGWKLGIATIALYLFEGAIGLPVFSGTPEQGVGLIYLMGPTFGYLIGFLVTVFLAGLFSYNNNIFKNFAKLTLATSFIYLLGVFWLGSLIGWEKPLYKLGVQPFLLAELFKLLLITIIVSKVQKIRKII